MFSRGVRDDVTEDLTLSVRFFVFCRVVLMRSVRVDSEEFFPD